MANNAVNSKNFIAAINMCIDNKFNQYNFITYATIIKVNDNYTIDVKPLGKRRIINQEGKASYIEYPELIGIPYMYLNTPSVGDNCVLLHLDTNISSGENNSVNDGITYIKGENKLHSLNNCVAICGFKNINENIEKTTEDDNQKHAQVQGITDTLNAQLLWENANPTAGFAHDVNITLSESCEKYKYLIVEFIGWSGVSSPTELTQMGYTIMQPTLGKLSYLTQNATAYNTTTPNNSRMLFRGRSIQVTSYTTLTVSMGGEVNFTGTGGATPTNSTINFLQHICVPNRIWGTNVL